MIETVRIENPKFPTHGRIGTVADRDGDKVLVKLASGKAFWIKSKYVVPV